MRLRLEERQQAMRERNETLERIETLALLPRSSDVSPGTVGAISELIVATDLLSRGYEVYRSMSPNSTYDLIARGEAGTLRIEVRTARRYKSGVEFNRRTGENKDYFAVVLPEGAIVYSPPLPCAASSVVN